MTFSKIFIECDNTLRAIICIYRLFEWYLSVKKTNCHYYMFISMKKNKTHYYHCTSVPTPVCRRSVTRF
nr:MAG TPA_asm: hypothetical protein [Caudoviricetes sp.]